MPRLTSRASELFLHQPASEQHRLLRVGRKVSRMSPSSHGPASNLNLQMNLKLQHVISDITGKSGLRIVGAILKGEQDPRVLARLRDGRIQV